MPDERELRDYLLPFLDVDDPIVLRMRHEPAPASARLLVTLGAGWIVDENAPSCVRNCGRAECEIPMRVSAHDLLSSRDCVSPGCQREAAPHGDRCDECVRNPPRPPVDDAALFGAFDDDDPRGEPPMPAVATTTCKHCTNPIEDAYGIYAGLCTHRKQVKKNDRAANGNGGGMGRSTTGVADGYTARIRALMPAAKSLDQAQRKLDTAGDRDTLKEAFDVASRRASGSPTADNLELLEKATKALRRGAPQREKAQADFNGAKQKFRVALGAIARDLTI